MRYIDDWDKRKARHTAFWEQEVVDRCLVTILGPSKNPQFDPSILIAPQDKKDALSYWTDGERILKRNEHLWDNMTWVGDGFPQLMHNLGPTGHAGYFKGIDADFRDSIWFHAKEKIDEVIFEEDNFWYKKTMELAEYYASEAKGEFFVSMTDSSGNCDALAAIKGADNLLMDMYTNEAYIDTALTEIQNVWEKTYLSLYNILKKNNQGGSGIGWLFTWAPGLHAQLQCDLAAMISPELFEKYAMKELTRQAQVLDYSLFHLDGVEVTRHLDHLLSIKELKAIQWTSVVGQTSALENLDALKRIQASGKSLLLNLPNNKELEPLMEELSSKGLHIISPVSSEDEGHRVIKTIERLTHE